MKLYFIRHGQTETNVTNTLTGQCEAALTDLGRAQAKAAAKKLEGITFDAVYSSDLSRAVETQKIMLPEHTAITTPRLREYDLGELVGKTWEECCAIYGEEFRYYLSHHQYRKYGGEDIADVKKRLADFLDEVLKTDAETVAVFCHAGVCKTMLGYVLDCVPVALCENCAVNVFEYKNGVFRLLKWNI